MTSIGRSRALWWALALAPIVLLFTLSASDTVRWLQTGDCPGGAMDRPAGPCGPLDFVWIVLLGGWVAYLTVPALAAWWMALGGVRALLAWRNRGRP